MDGSVRDYRLESALEFTTAMMSTRDVDELLRKIADNITDEFGFEACEVMILDKRDDSFVLRVTKGYPSDTADMLKGTRKAHKALIDGLKRAEKVGRFTYFYKARGDEDPKTYYGILHPELVSQPRKQDEDWHELDQLYVTLENSGGDIIGYISPDSPRDHKIPEESVTANLEIFAALASIAVQNAELLTELDRNIGIYRALLETTAALQEPVDLKDTLDKIADTLNKLVPFDEISVYTVDWERSLMTPIYVTGPYVDEVMADIGPISGLAGEVARSGKTAIVEDSMDDQRVEDIPGIEEEEIRQTIMCIPLKSKAGEVEGILELYRDKSKKFTQIEWALAEPFATHAAIALENARLREELKGNFESVQKAYEEMKVLDRAKDNLVNTISHELRTPLTTILGYLEMASEEMYGEIPPKLREKFGAMISSVNRINILVGKMLEMSRLQDDSLSLDFEPVNVAMITKELLKELESDILRSGHTVTVLFGNELPVVEGDRMRLHDVIQTLMSNAIRYTDNGGKITVGSDILGGKVHIWVRDTGRGISNEEKGKIFDRFYVADTGLVREDGRVGIGLYVSREIIRRHGGDMWFESAKGSGSTFHFTLPLKQRR
jgi:signal transduction histidine kinase